MVQTKGGYALYRMREEETRSSLIEANDVRGFFVESEGYSSEVTFLGVRQVDESRWNVEDAVLEVINQRRDVIGEYHVGRVSREKGAINFRDDGLAVVPYRIFVGRCEYPKAGEIWRRWAFGKELEVNEWLQWPINYHEDWLHVVQNSWFAIRRRAARYMSGEIVHLAGEIVKTRPGFYCALGEAMNGPGGYFGSNMDALVDCLSSKTGEAIPCKLIWHNHEVSNGALGEAFMGAVLAIMSDFGVEVVLL